MSDHPDDSDGYKSPKASVAKSRVTPFATKIPLDELHTCPMCNGKGFVGIVNEADMSGKLIRRRPKIVFPNV